MHYDGDGVGVVVKLTVYVFVSDPSKVYKVTEILKTPNF